MTRPGSRRVRVKRLALPGDIERGGLRYDTVYEVFPTIEYRNVLGRRHWLDVHLPNDSRIIATLPPEYFEDVDGA